MSRSGVNLANATNSLTDTSARHHKVSRVCVDFYNALVPDTAMVANNKEDFSAIRFEIALGIGRAFSPLGYSIPDNRGLAPFFTNTSPLKTSNAANAGSADNLARWYVALYDCRTLRERTLHLKKSCKVKGSSYWPSEIYFAGIVMSDAEAHPINGDTASTLFIGGQITIRNGGYTLRAGDQVQWYLDDEAEAGVFDEEGLRIARKGGIAFGSNLLDAQTIKIRDRSYGTERSCNKSLARIKPFRWGINGKGATVMDAARLVGVALLGAAPFEMVDIKISRQSH